MNKPEVEDQVEDDTCDNCGSTFDRRDLTSGLCEDCLVEVESLAGS